ncbi:hypothetical protein ACFY93_16445 [Streptomyces sp. NPDC008313]|uniref:hypothetical protein n=1 Tax=Streptomyces sp. NPDC008313 TaxID=3364826 RepID=UPI0036F11C3B
MWPGQQPPGGEQNPQDQNPYQQPGYQQPNPYQQPGYQQQNPYGQSQPQWGAPTEPIGAPAPPSGGGGNRTKLTAVIAATAVVVAAGVTGFLVLGGDKDDEADGGGKSAKTSSAAPKDPTSSASADNPRGGEEEKATVPGWNVVINPKWGTAWDAPSDWTVESPDTFIGFEDEQKDDGSAIIGMSAPAYYKDKWCSSDDDKDGNKDYTRLAAAGTKGQNGAKSLAQAARSDSATWAFAGYTGQSKAEEKKIKIGKPKDYTTKSGLKGSIATSYTTGVEKKNKCDSNGKATTFAFKNSKGDFVSWSFYGAKGVDEEVSEETIMKIVDTVRLHGEPTG